MKAGFNFNSNQPVSGSSVSSIDGVPPGGTTGQILQKSSNADYQMSWTDQNSGLTQAQALIRSLGS